MFKNILLALYILSGLGVFVINLTIQYDLNRYVRDNGIKFRLPLSERVAEKMDDLFCIFCPIGNFIILMYLILYTEEILKAKIDNLLDRQIFDKEEE